MRGENAIAATPKMQTRHAPLRRSTLAGISSGEFGLNLYLQTASLYLLYFYTDIVRMPPAVAGSIYMLVLVWDAVLDLAVGAFADNARTRLGRYRPYLTVGALPLALSFVSMFLAPALFRSHAIAIVVVTQVLFRTCYTLVSVPYAALSARVTRRTDERSWISATRVLFGAMGGLVVAGSALPVANAFAKDSNGALGWILIASSYAVVGVVALLVTARSAAQHDGLDEDDGPPPRLRDKLHAVVTNKHLLIVLLASFIASLSATMFQKGIIYYFKYAFGNVRLAAVAIVFMAVIVGVSAPFWAAVARRFDKRTAVLVGLAAKVLGAVVWWFSFGHGLAPLFVAFGLIALGTSASLTSFWAMAPDTVEYAEWRTGVRSESLSFGVVALGQKLAMGFGAGALGLFLSRIGFVANIPQSARTLASLRTFLVLTPLLAAIAIGMVVLFYRIGPRFHAQIVEEIATRRGRG